jgi:hypothetical protein
MITPAAMATSIDRGAIQVPYTDSA